MPETSVPDQVGCGVVLLAFSLKTYLFPVLLALLAHEPVVLPEIQQGKDCQMLQVEFVGQNSCWTCVRFRRLISLTGWDRCKFIVIFIFIVIVIVPWQKNGRCRCLVSLDGWDRCDFIVIVIVARTLRSVCWANGQKLQGESEKVCIYVCLPRAAESSTWPVHLLFTRSDFHDHAQHQIECLDCTLSQLPGPKSACPQCRPQP